MSTVTTGFEKLKTEYESCPDFHDIYIKLKDGMTHEINGFILQDGYLFLSRKLCIPQTSLREFLIWELHVVVVGHFQNEKIIKVVEYRFYCPSFCQACRNISYLPTSKAAKIEHRLVHSTPNSKLSMTRREYEFSC